MRAYAIRRILLLVPTLWMLTVVVFFLIRLIPGDVIDLMVAEQVASGQGDLDRAYFERALGLDVPIHVQYGRWIKGIFTEWPPNLGVSLWTNRPITQEMADKIPVSFTLGLMGTAIALIVAIPIGMYSAIRQDSIGDFVGRTVAILLIALPSFWLATMVIVFPAVWWRWSPPIEYIRFSDNPLGNLGMFIIPSTILGMVTSGGTMRMTRTMMLEVLRSDYIRTAWSKGLRERVVIFRHALRNAMIPIVTMIGGRIPGLIGGSVVLENIFCLPGVGRYMITAISTRDYLVISGVNLLIATVVMFNNLFIDLTYAWLDPRVHYR